MPWERFRFLVSWREFPLFTLVAAGVHVPLFFDRVMSAIFTVTGCDVLP